MKRIGLAFAVLVLAAAPWSATAWAAPVTATLSAPGII
jgi:hypothetical protein